MATKYIRINPRSNNTVINNVFGANRFIRKNFQITNFKINSTDYTDGDKIEIRIVGAKKVLFVEVQNATTGAAQTIEGVSTFTKGANDLGPGMYVRTAAIATAVDLNVLIHSTVADVTAINYATVTAS
ncbi:MAG: hypothetical protein WC549_01865 [Actinomycetota bacterium]